MAERLARIISYLFHPLLMPTYGIFLIFQLNTYITYQYTDDVRRFFYLLIFTFTFLAPVLVTIYLYRDNQITSLHIPNRKERWLPFLLTMLFYIFTYFLLKETKAPELFDTMLFGAALSIMISLIITFFWKISIHTVGIGGLTGIIYSTSSFLAPDQSYFFIGLVLMAGLVGFSRIKLEAHNLQQVAAGYVLGVISTGVPIWMKLL